MADLFLASLNHLHPTFVGLSLLYVAKYEYPNVPFDDCLMMKAFHLLI